MDQLQSAWQQSNSLLCVGLDPDLDLMPLSYKQADRVFDFCKNIIDATGDCVCAFKPQIAYFSALHAEDQLVAIIDYIHQTFPHVPVILDAKRADIGSTAKQYAREAFERFAADAVTVSPYMGQDAIAPYLDYAEGEKGVIILCRTSNPGGSAVQSLVLQGGMLVYQHIAHLVAESWNCHGNCALVVGGTFPDELAIVRGIVGDMPLLVPGIGAQGADVQAVVDVGQTARGTGLLINASRSILYASTGDDFAIAARTQAQKTRDEINQYRRRVVS